MRAWGRLLLGLAALSWTRALVAPPHLHAQSALFRPSPPPPPPGPPLRVLLLDNYDSYTYNLHQVLAMVTGIEPLVVPNDAFPSWQDLERSLAGRFDAVVLSPGPGWPDRPRDFGLCAEAIQHCTLPLLGVCLGHQGIACSYGGKVTHAPAGVMHGRTSPVVFTPTEALFTGLEQDFQAVRYHSLVADEASLPNVLEPIAWAATEAREVMALKHRDRPQWGLQFHPESVATEGGAHILANFRDLALGHGQPPASWLPPSVASTPRFWSIPPDDAEREEAVIVNQDFEVRFQEFDLLNEDAALDQERHHLALEILFERLFAESEASFWLDSATADPARGSEQQARFSFMGCASGPRAESVQYWASSGQLDVLSSRPVDPDTNLVDYLKSVSKRYGNPQTMKICPDTGTRCAKPLPFDFNCGLVGYFGYDMWRELEELWHQESLNRAAGGQEASMSSRAAPSPGGSSTTCPPDAWWMFVDQIVAVDHHENRIFALELVPRTTSNEDKSTWFSQVEARLQQAREACDDVLARQATPETDSKIEVSPKFQFREPRSEYIRAVERCQQWIHEGETYEVCLTTQLQSTDLSLRSHNPLQVYRRLRRSNPAPYGAFLRWRGDSPFAVCCSSPERFLRTRSNGWVESKPIKGTLPRTVPHDAQEDARASLSLALSAKDRAENLMIVDLVRNDLSRVCEVGSVHVPRLMAVESYATVHQLVSTIRGRLVNGMDVLDAVVASFPGGSMTGAPKERTMELIDQVERREARGVYSGTIGFLGLGGGSDLNIVIRTVVLSEQGATVGAGGAVTALSDPEAEFDEMVTKASAVLSSLGGVLEAAGGQREDLEEVDRRRKGDLGHEAAAAKQAASQTHFPMKMKG
mmetsp:Transcript_863/g.2782  ORF Transcript_863/g.2782 Transcript_863/m.2782 type:complete len:870 (-) Transcript_863:186-2795(-)